LAEHKKRTDKEDKQDNVGNQTTNEPNTLGIEQRERERERERVRGGSFALIDTKQQVNRLLVTQLKPMP
jgi:hypothetical protein